MNNQTVNKNKTRFFLVGSAAVAMLLFSITPGFGQKEDFEAKRATSRDGLMDAGFMTKADVSDDLDGSEDEYFYKFQAGRGKLTVTFEVVANETNAGAYLDLFGANSKAILSNMLAQGVDGGSERVTKSVNLAKAQEIVIRIKGLKYGSSGGYTGTYKVLLEGPAANFKAMAPADGMAPEKKPEVLPSGGTDQIITPDLPQSEGTGQDKKPTAAPSEETGQNKKPDAVDRAIEKGKKKGQKLLTVLDKVKAKIPD
ncbi:hypothetical protein BH20ACI2_BH20ACI2_22840 [soil metagenome]